MSSVNRDRHRCRAFQGGEAVDLFSMITSINLVLDRFYIYENHYESSGKSAFHKKKFGAFFGKKGYVVSCQSLVPLRSIRSMP